MHKTRSLKNPVKKYAKIFLLVVVAFFVAWVASSYTKSEIADRAIVLGLGIDMLQDDFVVTAEVVSPNEGGDSGASGATSKLLTDFCRNRLRHDLAGWNEGGSLPLPTNRDD